MISMSRVQDIRRMRREGESVAGISRATGVSEPMMRKYLKLQDLSPKMPVKAKGLSAMDECSPIVDSWLEADRGVWHERRHTARHIWERLVEEEHATMSYSTVRRYVKNWKDAHKGDGDGFLDQVGLLADMQVDFGQADFYVAGVRTRLHHLVSTSRTPTWGSRRCSPARTPNACGPLAVFGG